MFKIKICNYNNYKKQNTIYNPERNNISIKTNGIYEIIMTEIEMTEIEDMKI